MKRRHVSEESHFRFGKQFMSSKSLTNRAKRHVARVGYTALGWSCGSWLSIRFGHIADVIPK